MTAQEKATLKAVDFIKNCHYKGTAIKIELEAQFDRERGGCGDCDDGRAEHYDCDGAGCDDCDRGYVECGWCGGSSEWGDSTCKEFLHNHLSDGALNALIYDKVYYDGSVDTEWTLTINIDGALHLPEFIEAFNALGEAINCDFDTSGAGMHIAILNSTRGTYPDGNIMDATCHRNFVDSMTNLLPALIFLGASKAETRGFSYRMPEFDNGEKYTCIAKRYGVLEYRVFDTCYDTPSLVLDHIQVIANTLKYFTPTRTPVALPKIGNVPISDSRALERIYYSERHVRYLYHALRLLKPEYKSMAQLKRERNYTLTVGKAKKSLVERRAKWAQEYKEYRERFDAEWPRLEERIKNDYDYYARDEYSYVRQEGLSLSRYIELEKESRLYANSPSEYVKKKLQDTSNAIAVFTI